MLRPLPLLLALACTSSPDDEPPPSPVDSDAPADSDTPPPDPGDDTDHTDVAPPDPPPPLVVPPGVTANLGDRFTCLSPSLRDERRFDPMVNAGPPAELSYVPAGGVAVGDVDGNGLADVVAARQSAAYLFLNLGGGVLTQAVLFDEPHVGRDGLFGVALADYDGDDDLDIYVTNYPGFNRLLRNDGGAVFTDVSADARVRGPNDHYSTSPTFADLDLDGDLDLLVGGHNLVDEDGDIEVAEFPPGQPSLLFENLGDGTFENRTDVLPADVQEAYTFIITTLDLTSDGVPDLYFGNDFTAQLRPSEAVRGLGALAFDRDVAALGLDHRITAMGLGVGDLNHDGQPDLLLPGWNELGLLVSQGGTWFDLAQSVGVMPNNARGQKVAWGTEIGDLDNDGDEDLHVAFGYIASRFNTNGPDEPDALYLQDGPLQFTDRAAEWRVDHDDDTRGVVFTDINRDGWLDIVKASADGRVRMLTSRCADRRFSEVRLRQPGMNRHAVGARVEAWIGEQHLTRWLFAGGTGYGSSGPAEAHFGLADAAVVDRLVITWPDGQQHTLEHVPADHFLVVTRAD